MVLAEIMTESPQTISASATVSDAMKTIHDLDIRHLPVVEGRRLVGLLSDRDIRSALLPILLSFESPEAARDAGSAAVVSLMQSDVLTLGPESEVQEAIELMVEHKISAVPVVSAEGELVGIVTTLDVLRAAADVL